MDKLIKRKIRRLWRNRLLAGVGGLCVLGFSVLQIQAMLKYRSQQPLWVLELAQVVERTADETSWSAAPELALFEIREISQERNLTVTESFLQSQARARALDQYQAEELALARAIAQALDKNLGENPAQDQARDPAEVRVQARIDALRRAREVSSTLAENLAQEHAFRHSLSQVEGQAEILAETWVLAQSLIQFEDLGEAEIFIQKLVEDESLFRSLNPPKTEAENLLQALIHLQYSMKIRTLAQDLSEKLSLAESLIQVEDQTQTQTQDEFRLESDSKALALALYQSRAKAWDLTLELSEAQVVTQDNLLPLILALEIKTKYGLTLHEGSALERLLRSKPNRTRNLVQSGVLLSLSLLMFVALLFTLTRLQSSYSLSPTAQLVAFLPEDWVAELGALQRRMKKAKVLPWKIRLRLLEEFLTLLWVFYVQVRLENLGLPPRDRKTDD